MPTPTNIKTDIVNLRAQLEIEKETNLEKGISGITDKLIKLEAEIEDKIQTLQTSNDPKSLTEDMDDHFPVFLMPVRMEVRFMDIKHIARLTDSIPIDEGKKITVNQIKEGRETIPVLDDTKELWVRLFPDDIHIQTHEKGLTEEEISSAKVFWKHYNDSELEETENEKKEKKEGAWKKICITYGPERAAWIIRQTKGENYTVGKHASWTETPHTKTLPDRFVIKLVDYEGHVTQFIGNPIKDKIDVSINPDENADGIDNSGSGLEFSDNIKWMTDFHEAESIGLGIRVPLPDDFIYTHSDSSKISGFKQIIALGLNHSSDHLESKRILEELFENHTFKSDGMDLIPQGTKTNNSKSPDGTYGRISEDDLLYMDMALEVPQYDSTETDTNKKTDGQLLAEALGIDHKITSSLPQSGLSDTSEAMAMNRALWPATIGYYLKTMMHPFLDKQKIETIRNHFEDHVLGRGLLPSVRIDDQPYGIHLTSSFKNWKFDSSDASFDFKEFFKEQVLDNMFATWLDKANNCDRIHAKHDKHNDKSVEELKDIYLKILGHHASSVQFHQRTALGRVYLWNLKNLVGFVKDKLENDSLPDFDRTAHLNWMKKLTDVEPDIFDIIYTDESQILNGPVVDSKPSSEKRNVEKLTSTQNYIEWLKDAYYQDVFDEKFSEDNSDVIAPTSILYLLLRHSILLSYENASIEYATANKVNLQDYLQGQDFLKENYIDAANLNKIGDLLEAQEKQKYRVIFEQESIAALSTKKLASTEYKAELSKMIAAKEKANESIIKTNVNLLKNKFESTGLYTPHEFLHSVIKDNGVDKNVFTVLDESLVSNQANVQQLKKVKEALELLKDMSTAKLERCLAEHLDIGAYRLDSWYTSLANERIKDLRSNKNYEKGLYLGSYSWLLDTKPGSLTGVHYEEVVINKSSLRFADSDLKKVYKTEAKAKTIDFIPTGSQRIIEKKSIDQLTVGYKHQIEDLPSSEKDPNYVYLGQSDQGKNLDIGFDSVNNKFIVTPREDDNNQGFIHAPSITQAMAASVLRSAHNARKEDSENAFAINLKSNRVQKALQLLEGLSNGQSLAGLLGMQFERLAKEKTLAPDSSVNLMQYIYEFKKAYPFTGQLVTHNEVKEQNTEGAYGIVNGLALLEDYNSNAIAWGDLDIEKDNQDEFDIILDSISDNLDAVYDLMMAESVYQNILGNQSKSAAALDVLNGKGTYQKPEIIRTQRHYKTLTHKVGIQLDATANAKQWNGPTPRSIVEPGLNHYLGRVLPDPNKIFYQIIEKGDGDDGVDIINGPYKISALNIEPIDFYYFFIESNQKGDFYSLSNFLIKQFLKENSGSVNHNNLVVKYKFTVNSDEITLDHLVPFMNELKDMIGQSKILGPTELLLNSRGYDIDTTPSLVIETGHTTGWKLDGIYSQLQNISATFDLGFTFEVTSDFEESTWTSALQTKASLLFEKIEEWELLGIPIEANSSILDELSSTTDPIQKQKILNYLKALYLAVNKISQKKKTLIENLERELAHNADDNLPNYRAAIDIVVAYAQAIFGKSFKIFPQFKLFEEAEFEQAYKYEKYIRNEADLSFDSEQELDDWFTSTSRTKERIGALRRAMLFVETDIYIPKVVQLPFKEVLENGDAYLPEWLGIEYKIATEELEDDNLSLLFDYPDNFKVSNVMSGFIIDEWVEEIPLKDVNTGIGVHFDGPNSEPPQACLMVVSPEINGKWSWDHIMSSLTETLDMAAIRLVDPDKVDETSYAQVLPMLMPALTGEKTMPLLDFKKNIILDREPGDSNLISLDLHTVFNSSVTVSKYDLTYLANFDFTTD